MTSMAIKPVSEQALVTQNQSLTLMRNLLRTGISTICYMRDIFGDEEFSPMEFNGTSIMALRPKSADASDLTTWLEMGAFDAIKQKYLERLVLVIFDGDPSGADAAVLEEHSFSVRYPENDDGGHTLELVSRDHKRGTKTKEKDVPGSKSAVKKETTIFIRTLITVMQTMAPLPNHRYVSMRLHYNHSCPEDYEPNCFRSATAQDVLYFKQEPTTLSIGDVKTCYHQLTMKVKAAEFCEADELEDTCALGAVSPVKSDYHRTPETHRGSPVGHISPEYGESPASAVFSNDGDHTFLEAVKWAQTQDSVSHTKLAKELKIAPVKASEYCQKMFNGGILGQLNRGRRAVLANQLTQQVEPDEIETQDISDSVPGDQSDMLSQAAVYASSHQKIVAGQLASHLRCNQKQAKDLIEQMHREDLVGRYVQRKGAEVNQEALSQYLERVSEDQIDDGEDEQQLHSVDEIESSQQHAQTATPSSRCGKKRTLSDVLVSQPQRKLARTVDTSSDDDDYNGNGIVRLSQDSMYGHLGADGSAGEMKVSVAVDPIEQHLTHKTQNEYALLPSSACIRSKPSSQSLDIDKRYPNQPFTQFFASRLKTL